MGGVTVDDVDQLLRRAVTRRADGSRGWRARRAWGRLVQACAAGDPAAQKSVRDAELPVDDILDLLAAAPAEPADQAAYLALIGQAGQRQALDPDGSLLALSYRAASPELRERLREVMAAEGDAEVIRVVVSGEQRDRVAEMSGDELDYLGRQLAEHERWDELRRLALDLPLAKAAAAARFLPDRERTGERGAFLTALVEFPPERLADLVEKLPRGTAVRHPSGAMGLVSFSPDQAELAVIPEQSHPRGIWPGPVLETIRIATGEITRHISKVSEWDHQPHMGSMTFNKADAIVHLGDEIYRMDDFAAPYLWRKIVTRVRPDHLLIPLGEADVVSGMCRVSTGVVAAMSSGLVFVDSGSDRPRRVSVPRLAAEFTRGERPRLGWRISTWPESQLIAIGTTHSIFLMDESGTVLHYRAGGADALSFIGPDALAFISFDETTRRCNIRILSGRGTARHDVGHPQYQGAFNTVRTLGSIDLPYRHPQQDAGLQTALVKLSKYPLDPHFAATLHSVAHRHERGIHRLLAVSERADTQVYTASSEGIEVHNPHLPAAREALERPLLHATPQQWHHVRELRTNIVDPEVGQALDLLAEALADRFGADIALGSGPVATGGPHDIALGADWTE